MDILQLFANPAMLSASILAATPIVIHLLSRLRAREMEFPTLRFLRQTTEKTSRRRRIENWLLLLLRTLALLMLTFAAAGPVLPGGGFFGGSGISSIIIFDDSLSTDREDFRAFSAQALRETVRNLPTGSQWSLRYNCRPYDGSNTQRLSTHNREETESAINVPRPSAARGMLSRRTAEALATLAAQKGRSPELIIVTDGQLNEWNKLEEYCAQSNLPDNLRIYLFAPELKTPDNLSPVNPELQIRLPLPGEKAILRQPINYYGSANLHGDVSCFYQDKQQSRQEISLSGDSRITAELFLTLSNDGWQNGFTVVNGDEFAADNRRVFAVKVRKQLDVLLLGEGEKTFDEASVFFRAALAPLPQLPIKITQSPQSRSTQTTLDKFTAVLACFDSTPNRDVINHLREYVNKGGVLILFPGTQLNIKAWNNQWNAADNQIMAGKLTDINNFSKSPCGIQPQANAQGIFPDLTNQNMKLLANVKISKAFSIKTDDTPASEILTLFNSLPFMLAQDYGRGKIILFTSPPVNEWGLLQARPVFVPLMLSLLKLGPVVTAEESICGRPLNISNNETYPKLKVEITYPDNTVETKIFSKVSDQNPAMIWTTMFPGIYTVKFPELNKIKKYAVNPATEEGDLKSFDTKTTPALDKYGKFYLCSSPEQLASKLYDTRKDLSLTLPLEVIVILLLLAEGIIGMRRAMQQNN